MFKRVIIKYTIVLTAVFAVGLLLLWWAGALTASTAVIAILMLLLGAFAVGAVTLQTTARLHRIGNAANRLAKGDLKARVSVRGNDEIADLEKAFNRMAESLEQLEHTRNAFLSDLSHDLRTPMTSIAGFIDAIREGVIGEKERDRYLETVSVEIKRLSRLVTSLLELSRIQTGKREFRFEPFDICEVARLILISLEQGINEKHLNVAFLCDRDRMTVRADRDAIYQVLYNICQNAVKFSRDGGCLRVQLTETADQKLCVAVYNEGSGLSKEDLHRVFDRFYRGAHGKTEGTGLGLAISQAILAAHGERIWAESMEGENCEFFFTLPLEKEG
ncbi:MAG: HAMP domain-containing histidine kinase [Clostridia bacterium]|nr:HAMP domain-containing histidine kinase [Clostridia bacterium]